MQKHTKVYFKYFDYTIGDRPMCEVSWFEGTPEEMVDVHHINGRGIDKDIIENLMGVTRRNHDRCENRVEPYISKEQQKEIHAAFMKAKPSFI